MMLKNIVLILSMLAFAGAFLQRKEKQSGSSLVAGQETKLQTNTGKPWKDACGTCTRDMPADERFLLLGNVVADMGSTGLLSFLSASQHVSNLCDASVWQCEGYALNDKLMKETDKQYNLMEELAKHWNLAKPVLYDKLFPDEGDYSKKLLTSVINGWTQFGQINSTIPGDEDKCSMRVLPRNMMEAGIKKIRTGFIFMYTPLCIANRGEKERAASHERAASIQQLVDQHKFLTEHGFSVAVVNYGDLIWRTDKLAAKLQQFYPCLGTINTDLPLDAKNASHAQVTVKEFGRQLDYTAFGYNLEMGTCVDTVSSQSVYKLHPDGDKILKSEQYFQQVSVKI